MESDIERDWSIISRTAADVLRSVAADLSPEPRLAPQMAEVQERRSVAADDDRKTASAAVELIQRKRDRLRRRDFGLSLLLSNYLTLLLLLPLPLLPLVFGLDVVTIMTRSQAVARLADRTASHQTILKLAIVAKYDLHYHYHY